MNIIFMGTPNFAVPSLLKLIDSQHNVVAVFTQRPKPKNRGMVVDKSPVQIIAEKHNIEVYHPESLRTDIVYNQILAIKAECIVVVAYGMLIPQNIIDTKKYGCINLHPSSLPRFRGAAPLQRTIIAGDKETSVCIIQMDQGLDTGDILLCEKLDLEPRITFQELHDLTSNIGANLIIKTLDNISNIIPKKQTEEGLVYAHKLKKEEGLINWEKDSAFEIDCKVRGMNPWPGIYFEYNGELIKILETIYTNKAHSFSLGSIIDKDFSIACKDGILTPMRLQRPGKKPISGKDFYNSTRIK